MKKYSYQTNIGVNTISLTELKKKYELLHERDTWRVEAKDYQEIPIKELTDDEFMNAITYWNSVRRKDMLGANERMKNKYRKLRENHLFRIHYQEKFVEHYDKLFANELNRRNKLINNQ